MASPSEHQATTQTSNRQKRILEPLERTSKRPTLSRSEPGNLSPSINSLRSISSAGSSSPIRCPDGLSAANLICFGSVCGVSVQVRQDPLGGQRSTARTAPDILSHATLGIVYIEDTCWISLSSCEAFGCLNSKLSRCIRKVLGIHCVEIEAMAPMHAIQSSSSAWKRSGNASTLDVDLNIYGHAHGAKPVSQMLLAAKLFLQPPKADNRCLVYDNPQYLKLPDVAHVAQERSRETSFDQDVNGNPNITSTAEVEALFNDLSPPSFLREASTDSRIRTSLAKFQHVITGAKGSYMEDPSGGILADDMGLGKTLSMLAVIVATLRAALDFATSNFNPNPSATRGLVPSKTTLVVVPSSLLFDSWADEISKYHGSGKRVSISQLLQYDVIFTTYATLSAEFCRGRSVLNNIEWYRVVLDEGCPAHTIRNASSKQFRAIRSLSTRIRWCLTGTPIQNSLEDLGTIIKFLRVPILEDLPMFRKYIMTPAYSGISGRFTNLRRILESLCLRRTKSLLNLPDPVTDMRLLQLSSTDIETYQEYGASCKEAVEQAISGRTSKTPNQLVLEALLRMRLFCNHGPEALVTNWQPLGLPSDPQEILSFLQTKGTAVCVLCDTHVLSMYQEGDRSSGQLTICHHLVCGECVDSFKDGLRKNSQDNFTLCPVCGKSGPHEGFILDPSSAHPTPSYKIQHCSTKLGEVLDKLRAQGHEDKSVVFSFWKGTLDRIAGLLDEEGILYHRIHGSIAASKRTKILDEFATNSIVKILLITFGTGAVGINKLVVANHIHIIEPQWNPSVESQAVGRILRHGQERSVTIVRYIVKDTVEEAIQSRQLRKLQLAGGGFGLHKDKNLTHRIEEIMVNEPCEAEQSTADHTSSRNWSVLQSRPQNTYRRPLSGFKTVSVRYNWTTGNDSNYTGQFEEPNLH
ncbi:hypothetical protein K491DRAFT_673960 [Lophiostoma macrostomum CBS 122681]|uniref:Uncharacterized protein n=1 Tax=Lophiostoma macrostomum CBS 122681 TaxID=1314788 RepID=A0A6A6TQU5_9PLEO|nr:hypothetical protein K491DRAFT_673960 [Lophiostoma macrostomum CBS 122681]